MLARPLGRAARRVLLFFSKSFVNGCHAPVAKAAARVLAMELPVVRIAGISRERRPDLARYTVVPRDRDHVRVPHVVRTQEIDVARCDGRGGVHGLLVRRPPTELALPAAAGHITRGTRVPRLKRGISEEVRDAVRSKR